MLNAQLLRKQGYKQFRIAEMLGITERTVRNYLNNPASPGKRTKRKHKLDAFKPFIDSKIKDNPSYNCTILYDRLVRQEYRGRISILLDYVAGVRKKELLEAVRRFETEPGLQTQVDWKEYRRIRPDGKKEKVYAFYFPVCFGKNATCFAGGIFTMSIPLRPSPELLIVSNIAFSLFQYVRFHTWQDSKNRWIFFSIVFLLWQRYCTSHQSPFIA